MSYNGSGTFNINTTGQPVVAGTVISSSAFNSLTSDLATGLSTAITKDGQTTTTARITFAQGITSSLVTDSSSVSTGSIITDGGVGIAKNLYVGGTLNVTGSTSLTNPVINNIKMGYTTTATAAGTTTLTLSSNYRQFFTGSTTQTIVLPVTSTLVTGMAYEIENNSTGLLTVNSSGGNLVGTVPAGVCAHAVCIGTTLTTAADWDWDYISTSTITGTGANVLGTSPTITTPTISSLSSAAATALTLQSAGTTAITVDTSQNVGIGTASPADKLHVAISSGSLGGVRVQNTNSGGQAALSYYNDAATQKADIWWNNSGSTLNLRTLSTDPMIFYTNNSERMRIDSSGNVGIGTASPAQKLQVLAVNTTGFAGAAIQNQNTNVGIAGVQFSSDTTYFKSAIGQVRSDANGVGSLVFYNASSTGAANWATSDERMRITSAGDVLYGKTAVSYTTSGGMYTAGSFHSATASDFLNCYSTTSSVYRFYVSQGGTVFATSTTISSISDQRFKENVRDLNVGLAEVMALKPRLYDWKEGKGANIKNARGFIAQEFEEVFPDLIDEWKDPAPEGEEPYKSVRQDLIPVLVKAIQELKAINDTQAETINALTARITALENA